jgi:hypothetical protein
MRSFFALMSGGLDKCVTTSLKIYSKFNNLRIY